MKYDSLWDDELPTLGGSAHKSISYGNKIEIHELMDAEHKIVVRRESPLPIKPELIDGEKYIQNLYESLPNYAADLLTLLTKKL